MPRLPLPANLHCAELDHRARLSIRCSGCGKTIGRQGYDLHLDLPADALLAAWVARHVCSVCGIRPEGFVEDWPRSGAEGYIGRG